MTKTKVIYIYGSPAVGKLTTAKALRKLTGYTIIDNHMSFNPINEILDKENKNFWNYVIRLRMYYYKLAIKEKLPGIIITACHSNAEKNRKKIEKRIAMIEKYGGEVHFVWLTAKEKTIFRRVTHKKRSERGKLTDPDELKRVVRDSEFRKPMKFVKSFRIDTDKYSAKESAEKIVKKYKLMKF